MNLIILIKYFLLTLILVIHFTPLLGAIDLIYDIHTTKITGMGGSNVSISSGADSIFYNWSSRGEYLEWKVEQSTLFEDPYYLASIQNPFNLAQVRFGLLYQSISDLNETKLNSFNQPVLTGNTISHQMLGLYSSYNKNLNGLDVGLRHTLYYESIKSDSVLSNHLDMALHRKLSFFKYPLNTGITIKNIFKSNVKWSTGSYDKTARIFTAGLSGTLLDTRLHFSFDRQFSFKKGYSQTNTGVEYFIFGTEDTIPHMSLRSGLLGSFFTVGTTLNLDGWLFEYAYSYDNPFDTVLSTESISQHRFSIGKSFKKFFPSKQKLSFTQSTLNDIDNTSMNSLFTHYKTPLQQLSPEPKTFVNVEFKINTETAISDIIQSKLDNNVVSRLNFNTITSNSTLSKQLPLKWIVYPNTEKHIFIIDIDSTETNKLHISGYIPTYMDVYINQTLIKDINSDSSFYLKIDPKNTIEILTFKLVEKI
tara:strand:+ start:962 stop:2392 length:1431 start_codon:yes stop_codon:yes gene_type:complete